MTRPAGSRDRRAGSPRAPFVPFDEGSGPLQAAVFLERPNRFLCRVLLVGPPGAPMGEPVEAHLPDPGRLTELLVTGRRCWVAPVAGMGGGVEGSEGMEGLEAGGAPPGRKGTPGGRRTRWTMKLVQTPAGDGWVSLDTSLPNRILAAAFAEADAVDADALEELPGWRMDRAEATVGASRFDFLLRPRPGRDEAPMGDRGGTDRGEARQGGAEAAGEVRMILEAKSVTLVEEGRALFPDAVTARGTRHVREMAALARAGHPATVIFVAQREDVESIEAAWEIDPDFAEALSEARTDGVRVLGRRCRVTPEGITLLGPVPVLEPDPPARPSPP